MNFIKPTDMLAFGPRNYKLMVIGIVIIILGFTIMAMDSDPHGFGFLGLTLGPVITTAGFLFQIYAILSKPDQSKK